MTTRMSRFLLTLAVSAAVYVVLTSAAPQSILPTDGNCWTNGTHYGDGGEYATRLPSCWVAICNNEEKRVTVATPCTAGPDIMYGNEELTSLISRHCYPSARGELPGNQCCGGYPICAHEGKNREHFNITNYLKVMFDWQQGVFNYY
ncbi:uncharacterized protein LOC135474036 [Liolophura sinensis]|uniref:uncharacterized protein LOC135474036 n=1 Tax=Liolophura sinensis TaxID=3198878 RepID=UPI0031593117